MNNKDGKIYPAFPRISCPLKLSSGRSFVFGIAAEPCVIVYSSHAAHKMPCADETAPASTTCGFNLHMRQLSASSDASLECCIGALDLQNYRLHIVEKEQRCTVVWYRRFPRCAGTRERPRSYNSSEVRRIPLSPLLPLLPSFEISEQIAAQSLFLSPHDLLRCTRYFR